MKTLIRLTMAIAILFAGTASADPVFLDLDGESCGDGGISLGDVTGNAGGATECWGTFNGNDQNDYDGFENDGVVYTSYAKQDMDTGLSGTDIGLEVLINETLACSGDDVCNVGTWSFDDLGADSFLIVLKAASSPGYGIWLFSGDDADSTSGTWYVAWKNSLSHFAVYTCDSRYNDDCGGGSTVPEPGTLALLGLGLLGLGAARRRKVA